MQRTIGKALLVSWSALACSAAPGEEQLSTTEQSIIGGCKDPSYAAAGYLVREGTASCSAVLIEPDLVLTAGHCVDGHHDIAFGWGEVGERPPVRAVAHAVHPRYIHPPKNGGVAFQGFDIALLRLERAAEVPPATLGEAPPFARVKAVGYGATAYVAGDRGALEPRGVGTDRRSIDGLVRSQNATELFVRFDAGTSACYGDSGGPLFAEDGTVVAVLSRFTEIGRCLPRDRALMGYVRVDAMSDFLREAKVCLDEPDVQACLRHEERGLCATPWFETRATPSRVTTSRDGGNDPSSTTFDLVDHEERTVSLTPTEDVELTLDSDGDALLRVYRGDRTGEPTADAVTRVALEGGTTYAVVVRSCNGRAQRVQLAWRPAAEARLPAW